MPNNNNEQPNKELNDLLLYILQRTYPNRLKMKDLINKELNLAISEVSKIDGAYTITRNLATTFLSTANIELLQVRQFAKFMPGGLVISNPFYNTLLIYILTFCAAGEVDTVVYSISKYFTAIKLSYAKKKYFPVINKDLLNYTLVNGHGSTIAKQGWAALVNKVAEETLDKYIEVFKTRLSLYNYYRFMIDIHNKINQSVKHIARRYYANANNASVITTSESELVEKALNTLGRVVNSPQAIDFISRNTDLNEYEVERILGKLKEDSEDAMAQFQNIIARFVKQYRDREGINRVGVLVAQGRGMLMTGVPQNAMELLKDIGEQQTKENMKAVLYIALLCIMYSA